MDFEDFIDLASRFTETNAPLLETLEDTAKGLNDDDEEEMFSYLKKYIKDVRIHLSKMTKYLYFVAYA